jgi:hypothetical protein
MADSSDDRYQWQSDHVNCVSLVNTLKNEKNKKPYFHVSVAFHILEPGP